MVVEAVLPPAARPGRAAIRPPKFADKFAALDFDADPLPVISMFQPPPPTEADDLRLALRGEDLKPRAVRWRELDALPRVELAAPLVCQIFNWYEDVRWQGVRFADFLRAVDLPVHQEGYYAIQSLDGQYFETLSHDEAHDPRVLLACGMGDGPLPHAHGGPLRLVVPFLQGYKSVKWVGGVQAFRHDPVGIKRLLGQSRTARLGQAWLDRLSIEPAAGRAGDP